MICSLQGLAMWFRQKILGVFLLLAGVLSGLISTDHRALAIEIGCRENLRNLYLFTEPEEFDYEVMSFLDQEVQVLGLSPDEKAKLRKQLANMVNALLEHPVESKYFAPYFQHKVGDWKGFEKLFQSHTKLLIALFREYQRIRTDGSSLINSFDSNAPGTLQVALLQPLHWARFVNFYEFLEFYSRVASKRSARTVSTTESESSAPSIIYDSILYRFADKDLFSFLNNKLRKPLNKFEIWITPQTILEEGERLRNREGELNNLFPAFRQKLSEEEVREYLLLVEEVKTMRLEHSPSLPRYTLASDLRFAQMLFATNADYFVTPDFENLSRLYWPVKVSGLSLEVGKTKFRTEEITVRPQGSDREYTKKIVNLSEVLVEENGEIVVIRKHWKDSIREEANMNTPRQIPGRFEPRRRGSFTDAASPAASDRQSLYRD